MRSILASNHLAVADSFYLPLVVKRRITFLAKAEYFTGTGLKGWFTRWFYTAAGQVPIDRTDADSAQAALTTAAAHPRSGQAARDVPRGHPLARRPALQGQDGPGPARAGDRCPGHSGRDDRHRRGQPARQQDVAVRPGRRSGSASPMDFSRFEGLAGNRFIERAVIDEVMYELMQLSGQEYVDLYAADVKEGKGRGGREAADPASRGCGWLGAELRPPQARPLTACAAVPGHAPFRRRR